MYCIIQNLKSCIDECGEDNECNLFMLHQDDVENCPNSVGNTIEERINNALKNCKSNKESNKLCE